MTIVVPMSRTIAIRSGIVNHAIAQTARVSKTGLLSSTKIAYPGFCKTNGFHRRKTTMPSPITPKLIYELKTVSGPALSPDGATLFFAKAHVDEDHMEGRSRLLRMDLSNNETVPFSSGPKDVNPKVSPDGRWVAFFRNDDKERRQVHLIPTDGGEARALTQFPGGVSDFVWSPDSAKLLFVGKVDPDQLPHDHDPRKDPRVKVVTRVRYRFDTLGWVGDAHNHLFVIGLDDEDAVQLTDGDWDDAAPAWSPDGTKVAFVSAREPDREFSFRSQIYVVDAAGGTPKLWSKGLSSATNPHWSPDGQTLVTVGSTHDDAAVFWHGELYLLEPGKAPEKLTDDSMHPNTGFGPIVPAPEIRWTDDGRLLFLGDSKGESFLYELDLNTRELKTRTEGGHQIGAISFDAHNDKAVMAVVPPDAAGDLALIELASGSQTQLTHANNAYFKAHPPARMEKFSFERAGMQIQCRVLFPPDFDKSKIYPLVVDIHGGPHGAFFDAFNPWVQIQATSGYIVLCVNPRGSSSYGLDFGKAVLGDWGGQDYLDILAAVDELAAKPYVDEDRMGLHGYSYGGFMSAWIVGQTTRFKAAVVGAPCIDLPSFYGTSDIGISFGEVQWGGMRHEAYDKFLKHSPLTYAPRVETPVLLLHGEADHRCPIEQSEQYFVTLKRLGKTVEFVRFPGCSHLFLRFAHPRLREEYLTRMKAWTDRYLLGETAAPSQTPEAVSSK